MNDTLKAAGRIGAELGAAKAENERLISVLELARSHIVELCTVMNIPLPAATISRIDAALSLHTEPTDTYTAVDMATAAAQGFRDGQAAVKPAPAQDEREAFKRALHSQRVFKLSSATINAAEWAWFHRPAQTEQQPVAGVAGNAIERYLCWEDGVRAFDLEIGAKLYAAPIAQTAPQPELVETLKTCEAWFAKHSPTAPLIGGFGDAEHPMLTFIRAALSAQWTAEQ